MFLVLFILLLSLTSISNACIPPTGKIIKVTVRYCTCKEHPTVPDGLAITLGNGTYSGVYRTKYTVNGTVQFGDGGNWVCVPYDKEQGKYTISFFWGYQRSYNVIIDCSKKTWEYTYYVGGQPQYPFNLLRNIFPFSLWL